MQHDEPSNRNGTTSPPPDPRLTHLQRRLLEAFDDLWDDFVDPADAVYDVDGTRWHRLAGDAAATPSAAPQQLGEIRAQCRALAAGNEFAINAHENRISYLVGTGHTYRVSPRPEAELGDRAVRGAQAVLDEFTQANRWHQRQQEIVRRKDRDGECFLRLFLSGDGTTEVRFVEPDQVATPPHRAADPAAAMGIQTEPDDVETVLGYWIDGRLVDAAEIQFRKANVDANVRRGLPLLLPVRKNLRRAEKLLRNMSVVAEIQSAIAIIRKHVGATAAGVSQFVDNQADQTATSRATGRTAHFRRYGPGTILDAAGGTEYEFPAAAIDAGRYVAVLQAELRAIAARLVMPEFMLTSDASNAAYASTMVAEGPAVRMFERLQHELIEEDLELMRRVLRNAADAGRLAPATLAAIDIHATPPTLAVRDRLRDAQADQILVRNRAMSVETMAQRHGLNPDHERSLVAAAETNS